MIDVVSFIYLFNIDSLAGIHTPAELRVIQVQRIFSQAVFIRVFKAFEHMIRFLGGKHG